MSTRKSSHNFVLQIDTSNISRDTNFKPSKALPIVLKYRSGNLYKKAKTDVVVPYEAWDRKARKIKQKYLDSNPNLLNCKKELDRIENQFSSIKLKLAKGELVLESAFIELLEKSEDLSVVDWFTNNWKRKNLKLTTAEKILRVLSAVENHCVQIGEEQYKPLKFPHFADTNSVEKLGTIIRNNPKLSQNVQNNYMKILEQCVGKYDKKLKGCFTQANQVPRQVEKEVEVVETVDLYNGIYKIKTQQDLEAYLFWLLSFCLRGLDGQDITLIKSKLISSDFEINDPYVQHYVPDYVPMEHSDEGYYHNKFYLNMPRKKKGDKNMRILFNAYPTLSIIYHLKRLVKLNHPEYAGSNNDPYAIYGFDVNTQEGLNKWNVLRQNYGSKLKRLIGSSFKSTRHTFISTGNDAGISENKLRESIGHKVTRGALRNYKKTDISELDLIHLQIFDDSDIIHIYKQLVEELQGKKTFRSVDKIFFEGEFKWNTIEHYCFAFKLLSWSYQDEWALLKEEKKHFARHGRKSIIIKDGKPTFDALPEEHEELKALRKKKLKANKPTL